MGRASGYKIVPRKKAKLLHRMMMELAGRSMIALEGTFSASRFSQFAEAHLGTPGRPKRTCLFPRLDFIVLSLTPDDVEPVFKQILAAGLKHAIIHIQIVREGTLQFGAYDNLDPDCVVAGTGVAVALLEQLQKDGLIRSFTPCTARGKGQA